MNYMSSHVPIFDDKRKVLTSATVSVTDVILISDRCLCGAIRWWQEERRTTKSDAHKTGECSNMIDKARVRTSINGETEITNVYFMFKYKENSLIKSIYCQKMSIQFWPCTVRVADNVVKYKYRNK